MLATCMLTLLGCLQVHAQNSKVDTLASNKEWSAKYYYASNDNPPSTDWYKADFDDSNWETIQGPIYRSTYTWADYSGYWLRRHFTVEDISKVRFVFMNYQVDDTMQVFLNGKEVFTLGITFSAQTAIFPDSIVKLIKNGDNVLAVRAYDTGGGDKFVDFGLYAQDQPVVLNSNFSSSDYWSGSYDRTSYDNNYEGYRYGRNWECYKTLNVPSGLYRLSANACGLEYYDNYNTANSSKDNAIPAMLFINSDETSIPSVFKEPSSEDIYGNDRWETTDGFVPNRPDRVSAAFNRNMYKVEVWSYIPENDGDIKFGIHNTATNSINRWAAWDNFNLTYCDEAETKSLLDSMVNVISVLVDTPQNSDVKATTSTLLDNAKSASDYTRRAIVAAGIKRHEPIVRKSIDAYQRLEAKRVEMVDSLKKTASDFFSPATMAEANELDKAATEAYKTGGFDNEQVENAISKMDKLMERMSYTYLDISVTVPGAMGDSILSKVENFTDVKSLKISGVLNDADLTTIKSRLTNLREIDMTDVKMTNLPNRIFYQRSALEIVKLPSVLTSIGEYAFYQCYGLKNIDFPTALTTINRYAFSECDNLLQVVLPEGLTSLGESAFFSCDNNQYVKLPSTLAYVSSGAFSYNKHLKKVDFTEGLNHIYGSAFCQCYELGELTFPKSLYYIAAEAFAYDKVLSSIKFNEGLYQIGDNAFYHCDGLTEVTLPSSLVLCNASPFDYCDNLKKVTCLSMEPPYMTDQIPYGCDMSGRELYVPALSINTYKQTTGWDKFPTIKPIDYLPENFTVLSDLKLTLPETIPADYKPNVDVIHDKKGTSYWQYGSLTVNGCGTLSMNRYQMVWDPNYQYAESGRNQNFTSLVNNSTLRADSVFIQMYIRNDRWTFFTMPFNAKVSDIQPGATNWIIRKYDGQKRANGETGATWVKMTSDSTLQAGQGYIIQSSRYVGSSWQENSGFLFKSINDSKKNNIFINKDAIVKLNEYQSEFAHNRSWNLVGNPYPCYYDTRFMDFDAPITVWSTINNTYTAYSPVDDSYILCPGESFFVQRPVDSGTIVFAKDGRQTNRTARTMEASYAKRFVVAGTAPRTIINLTLSDGNVADKTRVVINESAAMQYEMDKDASKFMSTDTYIPQIYTSADGVDYAINERPFAAGTVNIGTRTNAEGFYTITLANNVEGYDVVLEDKMLGKQTLMTEGSEYMFFAKSGDNPDRFILRLSSVTGVKDINADDNTGHGNDAVYNLSGQRVNAKAKRGLYIKNGKKIMLNK